MTNDDKPAPAMYAIHVADYAYERVKAAIEREFPNVDIRPFPEDMQNEPGIEQVYLVPRNL